MKLLGLHCVTSLTRVSGDFLRTTILLITRPWEVIRSYVYGKRVGITSPVTFLILLGLYWGLMMIIIPEVVGQNQDKLLGDSGFGKLSRMIYGSLAFQYIFLAIPFTLGTYIVYGRSIRGRFNFAELLIAALYLSCTYILVNILLLPLDRFYPTLSNIIMIAAMIYYSVKSLYIAFPQPTVGKSVILMTLWGVLSAMLAFIALVIFAIPFMFGK